MRFKKLFVCNKNYGNDYAEEFDDKTVIDDLLMNIEGSEMIKETFRVMGICHTVVPEQNESGNINQITYQAASPDELALVKGAKSMDFIFTKRFPDAVILRALGTDERIQILNVLEFTSSRKRMSVVTRDGSGTIKLYTKGADAVILPRLSKNISEREHEMLNNQLNDYANHGYRTLCFAMKIIDEETYDNWKGRFVKASIALQSREEGLEQIAEELENDLTFVGASAIEDKLQIGVPETISCLLEAKIKIWILTGDKRETAINIAQSSALFKPDSQILILHGKTFDETFHCLKDIQRKSDTLKNNNQKFALVVDGTCLQSAITGECRTPFLDLSLECETVVCCRMSPMQKAEVVELVQSRCNHVMSVGDGANDVAMIQSANVGVGISGAEGLQAASASDYSIAQFRFLKRLILVHGAWNYNRSVKVILYSFYKNICLYLIELWFALYSAFSGQTLFERWTIASFNVIFTALPPIILGLFDRPVSEEQLINNPYLYKSLQKVSFSNAQFYYWIFMSVVHSIVLFWMSYGFLYNPVVWSTGNSGGWLMLGNSCYTFVIVTVCMKALIECDSWTVVIAAFSIGSIGLWFVFFFLYSIAWPILPIGADMAGHFWIMVSSPTFWFALILIPTTTLLPDVIVKCINFTMYPTMCDAAKLREKSIKRSIALTPSQLENSPSASYRPTTDRVSLNCQGVTRKCKVANNTEVTSLRPNAPDITHNYGTTCTIVPTPDGAYVNYACQDDQHNTYSRSETSQLVSVVHIPDTSV